MTHTLIGSGDQADLIKDTTIDSFTEDVLVASRQVPVLVDFWATWCGPCKALGPALESAVKRAAGKVRLVKIDIDKNQMLAQQLRIQSVPTVMIFIAGQPVDAFQGALPETQIASYIDRAIQMATQAGMDSTTNPGQDPEALLEAAQAALSAGDLATAAQSYGMIAEQVDKGSAHEARALAGLVQCHIASQNMAEAAQMLEIIPEAHHALSAVASAKAALSLAHSAPQTGDLSTLKANAAKTPEDQELQFALANAQISCGNMTDASHTLLTMIAHNREWSDSAARQKLLTLFDALGPTHEVTLKARRKLSSLLFS